MHAGWRHDSLQVQQAKETVLTAELPVALLISASALVPQRTTVVTLDVLLPGAKEPPVVRALPVAHITLSAPGPATDRWICTTREPCKKHSAWGHGLDDPLPRLLPGHCRR